MNKSDVLFILQITQSIFTIAMFVCPVLIYYLFKNKSIKGFMKYVGIYNSKKGAFFRSFKIILFGYLFTIFVYIMLYFINGKMETFPLRMEYESCNSIIFIIIVILMGLRAGVGEEIFFRGWIANNLIKNIGFNKGNIIQAIIFALPHIITFSAAPSLESILLFCNAFVNGYCLGYKLYK